MVTQTSLSLSNGASHVPHKYELQKWSVNMTKRGMTQNSAVLMWSTTHSLFIKPFPRFIFKTWWINSFPFMVDSFFILNTKLLCDFIELPLVTNLFVVKSCDQVAAQTSHYFITLLSHTASLLFHILILLALVRPCFSAQRCIRGFNPHRHLGACRNLTKEARKCPTPRRRRLVKE